MKTKKLKLEKFVNESPTISLITNGLRLQKKLNTELSEYEVTLNQALILLSIFFEPEKVIRSNELQSLIPSTKGNISHCTSHLEQKKLITRKMLTNDLRGFEFHLSSKGQKLCLSLIKYFDELERMSDKRFTSQELKDFIDVANNL